MNLILNLIFIVRQDIESDVEYMYRTLCSPMRCKTNNQENVDEIKPVTITVIVLPIVIIIVVFVIIIIFITKSVRTRSR